MKSAKMLCGALVIAAASFALGAETKKTLVATYDSLASCESSIIHERSPSATLFTLVGCTSHKVHFSLGVYVRVMGVGYRDVSV